MGAACLHTHTGARPLHRQTHPCSRRALNRRPSPDPEADEQGHTSQRTSEDMSPQSAGRHMRVCTQHTCVHLHAELLQSLGPSGQPWGSQHVDLCTSTEAWAPGHTHTCTHGILAGAGPRRWAAGGRPVAICRST